MAAADPFGSSLKLDEGDIVLDPGTGALKSVEGKLNLLQALQVRVLTPFGTDMFNTTYGFDVQQAFVQPNTLSMVKQLITMNLVSTLGTDIRVTGIREVLFEDDPQYLARHPELGPSTVENLQRIAQKARRTRLWHVEVTIDTIDGGTATVATSVGV